MSNKIGTGLVYATTIAEITIPLANDMRTVPTFTYTTIQVADATTNGAVTSVNAISRLSCGGVQASLIASGGGLTVGRACQIRLDSSSDYIALDAEL